MNKKFMGFKYDASTSEYCIRVYMLIFCLIDVFYVIYTRFYPDIIYFDKHIY